MDGPVETHSVMLNINLKNGLERKRLLPLKLFLSSLETYKHYEYNLSIKYGIHGLKPE